MGTLKAINTFIRFKICQLVITILILHKDKKDLNLGRESGIKGFFKCKNFIVDDRYLRYLSREKEATVLHVLRNFLQGSSQAMPHQLMKILYS